MAEGNDSRSGSSLELVLENLVHDEESDINWNLHQEINFDPDGELREVNLQEVQMAENTESSAVENIRSRLINILAMCTDCDVHLNPFLISLHEDIEREISPTRVEALRGTLLQWEPFYFVLRNVMSDIERLIRRVENPAQSLSDRFINLILTTCDDIENDVHGMITYILDTQRRIR